MNLKHFSQAILTAAMLTVSAQESRMLDIPAVFYSGFNGTLVESELKMPPPGPG